MRLARYFYSVEIVIEIDRTALDNMILCSRRHTDAHCRQSVAPGGFIYMAKQDLDRNSSSVAQMRLTLHELGVLYKLTLNPAADNDLRQKVKQILDQAYSENQKINRLSA